MFPRTGLRSDSQAPPGRGERSGAVSAVAIARRLEVIVPRFGFGSASRHRSFGTKWRTAPPPRASPPLSRNRTSTSPLGERCRSQGRRDGISVILDSMHRERDANDAPGNRQYRVVSRRVGDRTRRTLVVVAQGPLAAALDAFARLYSSPPEVIDVSALHSAGEQSFLVTIEAAPRERYRLFVALDRIDPPSRAGTR